MYKVVSRIRQPNSESMEHNVSIVCANDSEDAVRVASYHLGKFVSFDVSRVKPSIHTLYRTVISEEGASAEGLKQCGKEVIKQPTLQSRNSNMYAFGLIGYIQGESKKIILKRLSSFLLNASMGRNVRLPFKSNGDFILDEIGETSSVKPNDLSRIDINPDHAKFFSGGGVSPR